MAAPDEAQAPGTDRPDVPTLIHDYRALQEAMRAHAQGLARVRDEMLAAAEREARDTVSAARSEVRRILVKARRDLLELAGQVQSAMEEAGTTNGAGDANAGGNAKGPATPVVDLRAALDRFVSARRETHGVLDGVRPDLAALDEELDAFTARLRQGHVSVSVLQRDSVVLQRDSVSVLQRDSVTALQRDAPPATEALPAALDPSIPSSQPAFPSETAT